MSAEETIFQEAQAAVERGERARARDLLTRLLKANQGNPQYWLWMSAVVDSARERIYCLNEALRRDPENVTARRGLIFSGALPPPADLRPAPVPKRAWQVQETAAPRRGQFVLFGGAVVLLVALVYLGLVGARWLRSERAAPKLPTLVATLVNSPAPSVTVTSSLPSSTPGITPLALLLEATYTPTPLYVNTPHPRSEAYRSALRAHERQAWSEMLQYLEQVATAEPGQVDILYHIGEAHRLAGNYNLAIQAYNHAIALAPSFAPPRLGLARALRAAQPTDARQIEENLREALRNDPNLSEAYLELAGFYLQRNLPTAARNTLQSGEAILQHAPLFFFFRAQAQQQQGEVAPALADARRANQLDQTYLPAYRLLGQLLQQDGAMQDSISPLEIYTRYQPEDAQALVWLGQAYQVSGAESRALQIFDRVLQVEANTLDVYLARGEIRLERGEGDAALDDFDAALRLKSDSWDAGLGKGRALMLMGYNGDAYIQFNRSEGLAKSDAEKAALYYWRAQSLEALKDPASNIAALRDWDMLLALPAGSYPPQWAGTARQHRARLFTATPSPRPTFTLTPSATIAPSLTPSLTASPTPAASATRAPTALPFATKTP